MIYHREYRVLPTTTFKEELGDIIYYIKRKLKEPILAKRLYQKVIKEINSLTIMPERFQEIRLAHEENRILRKMHLSNYIIIYEVKRNTRTSFYFTYISWYTKLS